MKLFLVTRKPKQRYTDVYKTTILPISAKTKAEALRRAEQMQPVEMAPFSTEQFRKPEAIEAVPGTLIHV